MESDRHLNHDYISLMIELDSLLSLLYYRYTDRSKIPFDLQQEINDLLARVREVTG